MTNSMRLFFALPVPDEIRQQIDAWRHIQAIPGRWVHTQDLHITLVFLGQVSTGSLEPLKAVAANLRCPAFHLRIDQISLWHGGLLLLSPSRTPTQLLELQQDLARRLSDAGMSSAHESSYRPHLTLGRDVRQVQRLIAPDCHWKVENFGLFRSDQPAPGQPRYRAICDWPLQ